MLKELQEKIPFDAISLSFLPYIAQNVVTLHTKYALFRHILLHNNA